MRRAALRHIAALSSAALLSAGLALAAAVQAQTPAPSSPAPAAAPAASTASAADASPVPGVPAAQAEALLRSDRFRELASELRCLVCQNQTLADSNAPLAIDLRNEVLRLMASGRDDGSIKGHLVDRYGEFVLYRPTMSARNVALWAGPFVLVAIGAIVVWRLGRRSRARPVPAAPGSVVPEPTAGAGLTSATTPEDELARIDRLLGEEGRRPPR